MRKGVIEIGTWTLISSLLILLFNNLHEDIGFKKDNSALKMLRKENCIENPTPEQETVCKAVNDAVAAEKLK